MITNIEELKEFIKWAKDQRLEEVSIAGVSFKFNQYASIEHIQDTAVPVDRVPDQAMPPYSPKLPGGNTELPEDEQLLYWSTK